MVQTHAHVDIRGPRQLPRCSCSAQGEGRQVLWLARHVVRPWTSMSCCTAISILRPDPVSWTGTSHVTPREISQTTPRVSIKVQDPAAVTVFLSNCKEASQNRCILCFCPTQSALEIKVDIQLTWWKARELTKPSGLTKNIYAVYTGPGLNKLYTCCNTSLRVSCP